MKYKEILLKWLAANHPDFTPEFSEDSITNWQSQMGACPSPKDYQTLLDWHKTIAPDWIGFATFFLPHPQWNTIYQNAPALAAGMQDLLNQFSGGREISPESIAQFTAYWAGLRSRMTAEFVAEIAAQATTHRLPQELRAIVEAP